jgi:hypothetical protein
MGDPGIGPVVTALTKVPGSVPGLTDDLIEDRSQLSHFHRSDVFRMAIGDEPDQINHAGKHLGPNDFFVMRASKRYNESLGRGNVRFLDIYADRRGLPATMVRDAIHPAYEEDLEAVVGALFCTPPHFHRTDETVATGIATSFADIPAGGRLHSTIADQEGWTSLSDGSVLAVAAIGDPKSGPLVILSRTAPGVHEPEASWDTDVYRLVIGGSCTVGGITLRQRQFRAVEAGVAEGEVVHGPDGSTQVLVIADRRQWRPKFGGDSQRYDEVAAVIGKTLYAIAT